MGLRVLPGGGVEQSPVQWWRATAAACRRLAARADGDAPAAVAVTAQWAGTVPVGADGEALSDALIWMDARGAPFVRRAAGGPIRVAGYGPLRLARWLRRTGGAPALSGRDPFGHILWLRHERPEVYDAAAVLLEPADWLGLCLTGRAATTAVTATLHWLTDTRDLHRIRYDDGLLRAAGVDAGKLPELLPTNTVLGPLAPTPPRRSASRPACRWSRARRTRCRPRSAPAPWPTAPHTCTWARRPGCPATSTSSAPTRSTASPRCPPPCPAATSSPTSRRPPAPRWRSSARWSGPRSPSCWPRPPPCPRAAGGVLFAPWLNGERTPVDDHLVRGGWLNIGLDTTRAQLARATLEGVALNLRWMQGPVERFARRRLEPLAFVGGGARSELWCQIMADVLDREVRQIADPIDANVRGAALLAGLALDALSVDDIPGRVAVAGCIGRGRRPARPTTPCSTRSGACTSPTRRLYRRLNDRSPG